MVAQRAVVLCAAGAGIRHDGGERAICEGARGEPAVDAGATEHKVLALTRILVHARDRELQQIFVPWMLQQGTDVVAKSVIQLPCPEALMWLSTIAATNLQGRVNSSTA